MTGTLVSDVVRNYPSLLRQAWRITRCPHAAEDAVQNALLRLLAGGWQPDNLEAGLRTMVTRAGHDVRRRAAVRRAASLDESTGPGGSADATECAIEQGEVHAHVRAAVVRLPPQQRTAVTLFYFEGLPVRTVAAAMQVSEATVKSHLFKARASLGENLKHVRA